jgi:RNA polymerase sigma-70 factor, ECF subfamily
MAHLDMLYSLARRMTSGREEAEDLVQETYAQALRSWRRAPPDRIAPWLATICLNTARSQLRRRASRPTEILDPEPGAALPDHADTEIDALRRLDREAVLAAVRALPIEQREAVALMDLRGLSAAEIAKMLGVPRNTVLSRAHRGHKRLAVLLEEVRRRDP